jgi:hypothetical protein
MLPVECLVEADHRLTSRERKRTGARTNQQNEQR